MLVEMLEMRRRIGQLILKGVLVKFGESINGKRIDGLAINGGSNAKGKVH